MKYIKAKVMRSTPNDLLYKMIAESNNLMIAKNVNTTSTVDSDSIFRAMRILCADLYYFQNDK